MKRLLLAGLLCSLSAFAVNPDYPSGPQILGFYGTLEPKPVFYPNSLDFGTVEVGKEKIKKIKVLNEGYGYLVFKKIYLVNGTQFAIKDVNCPGQLFYGQSCFITVAFKPTEAGDFKDELDLVINSDTHPIYRIPLSGKATAPKNAIVGGFNGCGQPATPPPTENYGEVYEITPQTEPTPVENETAISKGVEEMNATPQTTTVGEESGKTSAVESGNKTTNEVSKSETTPKVAKEKENQKPEEKQTYKLYTVKPCDTLWDLSAKFYGTPLLWAAIYEANKNQIRDPWIIKAGMVLKIPVNLTPQEIKKYKAETLKLMKEMADRPLGPKCPLR